MNFKGTRMNFKGTRMKSKGTRMKCKVCPWQRGQRSRQPSGAPRLPADAGGVASQPYTATAGTPSTFTFLNPAAPLGQRILECGLQRRTRDHGTSCPLNGRLFRLPVHASLIRCIGQ
jgi:hypothetical protein